MYSYIEFSLNISQSGSGNGKVTMEPVGAKGDQIKRIKGIGPKSAQRLIIELQDKLSKGGTDTLISAPKNNTSKDEALSALVMLGFTKNIAEKVVDSAIRSSANSLSVEEIIKIALKTL
jgi:Holliday junction DNA helicase RuvA